MGKVRVKTAMEEYTHPTAGECASAKEGEEDSGCRGRRGTYDGVQGANQRGETGPNDLAESSQRADGAVARGEELSHPHGGIILSRDSRTTFVAAAGDHASGDQRPAIYPEEVFLRPIDRPGRPARRAAAQTRRPPRMSLTIFRLGLREAALNEKGRTAAGGDSGGDSDSNGGAGQDAIKSAEYDGC
ncbi:hypothetical protein EAI_01793 [Harpegnathos saltator]|uniref:Uncharacterized protein n=1 Tax=Harpegnathos saltator TaxID=610380 RepID=E2BBT9_HARSA|nr:hypothetical protein EAI_01793 [Harpegnathos saltator]